MQSVRKFSPLACLVLLLLLFIGWRFIDWKTTTVLPWAIWLFLLFLCTAAWNRTTSGKIVAANAILTGATFVAGLFFIGGIIEIAHIWILFILSGFAVVHLYLFDISMSSTVYKGAIRYLLFLPGILTIYALVALFSWNGSLFPAWIGLLLMVFFALIGLFGAKKT